MPKLSKALLKWVQNMLTELHKHQIQAKATYSLERYRDKGYNLLSTLVTDCHSIAYSAFCALSNLPMKSSHLKICWTEHIN